MPVYTGKATDFVNFSRGSLATVTDSDGKIKWAPHNLLTNSENFSVSPWVARNSAILNNVAVAPNGTTTADSINGDGANTFHYVEPVASFTYISVSYTLAVFMKKDTNRYGWVSSYDGTNTYGGVFDLQDGVYVGNRTGSGPSTNSITPVGNGWFLCSITYTPVAATTSYPAAFGTNNDGNLGLIDANTGKIFLWGAHLYRSDLGGMQSNGSAYPMYNPTTPKNFLGYTEDFSNIGWQQYAVSVTKNATIAPNGLQLANKIVETSANSQHYVTVPLTLSGIFTFSVYAKAAERTFINLWFSSFGSGAAYFNLTNGTYVLNAANYAVSAEMISVGNGWYRCSIKSGNFPSATYYPVIGIGDTQSYTGDTSKGVYIWGAQLSDSASLDPYVANHFAIPTSAAYYGPRIDYDPVSLSAKGLLVEEQRTNFITYSSDFSNAFWNASSSRKLQIITDQIIAPDGTLTADKVVEAAASDGIQYQRVIFSDSSSSVQKTFSVFAKKAERKRIYLFINGPDDGGWFDLDLGTCGAATDWPGGSVSITPFGNGWYRCSLTPNGASGANFVQIYVITDNATTYDYRVGDGTSGVYLWGAQLEAGVFATSYIPTIGSQVTRNSDIGQISVNAIPYSTNECTFVIDVQRFAGAIGDEGAGVEFSTGAFQTNVIQMMYDYGSYNSPCTRIFSSGGGLVFAPYGSQNSPNFVSGESSKKIGVALKSGNSAVAMSGVAGSSYSTAFLIPQTTRLKFSTYSDGAQGSDFMGWIRNITYIPRRVTNEDLQQRTL